ncbi:1,4-dihydroxy-2-naphthoate polyprenyltransferase [Salirhabdus salicampi]|uniref:1,4-dihydroxy-2-naphthoate polyprenyltransferase n=1 Tax=Salirhabdus salicampi TaxID=476102 RepID=UPI0020C379AE|nr:1,4-dihydroxy-2-naphthoate polyprenyltransferase [Salirhabdus salicampi]MCP8617785.1 1,4-dihydroxy-2-naphthoate polyprenyltransferase [Salirhabdus salicampi]
MNPNQNKKNVKQALNEKPGFQAWWRMLRPHTLTASFVPVFVGTMLASFHNSISLPLFLSMLLAAMFIQAATNMFNEYFDYVRGLDNENSVGIGGTIVRDGFKPKTVLRLAYLFFFIAMLLGVFICYSTTWWIAVIGLVSMAFGYFYTGGPLPIAYTPFGEIVAGFFMGTVLIGISYYIHTFSIDSRIVLLSIPVAILIGAILLANNIRDLRGDKKNGRKTVAILLGHDGAVTLLASLFFVTYLMTIVFIFIDWLPIWSLITLFSMKKAYRAIQAFKGKSEPLEMMPAMVKTAQTNTMYGILLGISFIFQHLFPLPLI